MSWIEDLIKSRLVQLSDTTHETVAPIIYNARTREKIEKLAKEGTERLRQLRRQGKQAVFRPDNRTSDLRARDNKEADYKHQLYQKQLDDLKRAEGLENLMKLSSPSTYVEAATGEQLTPAGKLAADALIFGIGGAAKNLLTRGGSKAVSRSVLGEAKGISGKIPQTPEQWTAAQDAAIARGDMAEVQRLRDLHFQVSSPNTQIKDIQYHGAKGNAKFNVFDPERIGQTDQGWAGRGYYFTPTIDYAKMYGSEPRAFYINAQKVHDGTASTYFGRENSPAANAFKRIRKKHGNDGQQILDELASSDAIRTSFPQTLPYNGIFEEVVTRNNNQMKLADAVTYDNNGVRIPLGERDNFNINDIRYFSTEPVTRANPVHTMEGNPLATRLARLREHTLYGFTPETNLGLMITPLLRVSNVRSFAKQIDPSLTDDLLDLIVQIAYANGLGVHIPIGNNAGATTGGLSIVDIQDAINYLKLSGIKNITSNDIGIIAGHEAGHGVQVSPAARRLVEGFAEPDEFYTRAGQVLDAAGITATADSPVTYNKFVNLIDKYLKQGNLDNGVSELKQFMIKLPPLERQKVMKYINRLSAGTGLAYLINE